MALVYIDMPCSLCGQPIRDGDVYVACAHFIYEGPLSRQSDSGMHRHCFDAWEHREEFTRRYRKFWASIRPDVEHDWPDSGTCVMVVPETLPGPGFVCPACGKSLYIHQRSECPQCGWLRFGSDRARWRTAGACPHCGFEYRWDGARCSHCGFGTSDLAARPAT